MSKSPYTQPINPRASGKMRREEERRRDILSQITEGTYVTKDEDDVRVLIWRTMIASHSGRIG